MLDGFLCEHEQRESIHLALKDSHSRSPKGKDGLRSNNMQQPHSERGLAVAGKAPRAA